LDVDEDTFLRECVLWRTWWTDPTLSCPTRNDSRKLNGFIKSYKWRIVSKYQEMLGTFYGSAGLYRYCREIVLYNA
jgi:hypothetical protein